MFNDWKVIEYLTNEETPLRPFLSAQMDTLRLLGNQITLAETQIRAATAERDLARERANLIKVTACAESGFPLAECE